MARASSKEEKNVYWQARDKMGWTREQASDKLKTIPPERVARIEYEQFLPHLDEVLLMAEQYKDPMLCNYYCSQQCPIGQQYVPEIQIKDLSQIVLEMLASLNTMQRQTERLVDISADGIIDNDELIDFIRIQKTLEKISITVETLQLWAEQMLATGKIDIKQYQVLTQQ